MLNFSKNLGVLVAVSRLPDSSTTGAGSGSRQRHLGGVGLGDSQEEGQLPFPYCRPIRELR